MSLVTLSLDHLRNQKECTALRHHGVEYPIAICHPRVPQGTLCGPILWLAFLESLHISNCVTTKFADYTATYFFLSEYDPNIASNTRKLLNFI